MKRLGFIGLGHMGSAVLQGIVSKGVWDSSCIYAYDIDETKPKLFQQAYGVLRAQSEQATCAASDIIVLAVKPVVCQDVLTTCAPSLEGKAVISIVTGWSREKLAQFLPESCRILRVMPNTPCMVSQGMTVFDRDHTLNDEELEIAKAIFSCIGKVELVAPSLMSAVTGVSGSGPAYVYVFIEALADGGVRAGLSRDLAYRLAAQTVLGAANMVLETKEHPGALKDAVCSPAGTTIEAIAQLEQNGFRNAVLQAVDACVKKAQDMSQQA